MPTTETPHKPPSNFVNHYQTSLERSQKYFLARSMGYNVSWARSMRDWSLSALEKRLGLERTPKFKAADYLTQEQNRLAQII